MRNKVLSDTFEFLSFPKAVKTIAKRNKNTRKGLNSVKFKASKNKGQWKAWNSTIPIRNRRFYKGDKCKNCGKYITIKNRSKLCRSCRMLGHTYNIGRKHTEEWKNKLSTRRWGKNNPNWKGDNIGYTEKHRWIKRRLKKPEFCQECGIREPYDLANKGIYNRNLSNWEWLCRKCHMIKDERMNNLRLFHKKKLIPIKKLIKEADRVFSIFIRNRDKACVICKSRKNIQCGHLFKRGKHSTRFEEVNCHALCTGCNYKDNFEHDHYVSWFLNVYGENEYARLYQKSKQLKKWTRLELESIISKYAI